MVIKLNVLMAAGLGLAAVLSRAQPTESALAVEPVSLVLLSPSDYQVFQRKTLSGNTITVDVFLDTRTLGPLTNFHRLEARLLIRTGTNESPGTWQALPFDNRLRRFQASLQAPAGGWHRLEVKLVGEDMIIAQAAVDHVGVGEVFVVAGQSNAANFGEDRQSPKNPYVVAFGNGRWQPANDPQPGAGGKRGSFIPAFGDAMAAKFQVPIGLISLGEGATSVREWLPRGQAMAVPPRTGANTIMLGSNLWVSTGELLDRILDAQQLLGTNGFRALLWHQGESDARSFEDREITATQYAQYLRRIIEYTRSAAGWRVPWFVAQASYRNPGHPGNSELRDAQKSVVIAGIALGGPNTDELGSEFRERSGQGVHFSARGLQRHGELWAEHVGPWLEQQKER